MSVNTSANCKISIGTTAANAENDTYKRIGKVTNAGDFGPVYQEIKFDSIDSGLTLKFKGQRDDGSMQVDLGRDPTDEGQAAAILARDSYNNFNFKVELNDHADASGATNTIFYFKALVMSYTTNIGGPNQVVAARTTLAIQSGTITEVPASA